MPADQFDTRAFRDALRRAQVLPTGANQQAAADLATAEERRLISAGCPRELLWALREEIAHAHANAEKVRRTGAIFLSYSRRDVSVVKLFSLVVRATGRLPWRDQESIDPGADWEHSITKTISECDRMLLFWCRHSARSKYVRDEYQLALDENTPVVPVLLDRTPLNHALRRNQAIDVGRLALLEHQLRFIGLGMLVVGLALLAIGYSLPH